MKIIIFVLAALIWNSSYGQIKQEKAEFGVGLPTKILNLPIHNVYNSPNKTIRLSDFKGKVIILDFSNLTCHGCVLALPGLDSLQSVLKDKLQVIWVVTNKVDSVKAYLQRNPGKHLHFPIVAEDKVLKRLFNNPGLSTLFWIDPYGNLCGMTNAFSFENVENVEKLIPRFTEGENKKEVDRYKAWKDQ